MAAGESSVGILTSTSSGSEDEVIIITYGPSVAALRKAQLTARTVTL
jgi:hypothetical protein